MSAILTVILENILAILVLTIYMGLMYYMFMKVLRRSRGRSHRKHRLNKKKTAGESESPRKDFSKSLPSCPSVSEKKTPMWRSNLQTNS